MSVEIAIKTLLALLFLYAVSPFTVQELPEYSSTIVTIDSCGEVQTPITKELNDCPECLNQKINNLSGHDLQDLHLDFLKRKILNKLHLPEAPCIKSPKPPMQSILAAVENSKKDKAMEEVLEYEDEEAVQDVVVFANNENFSCSTFEESNCTQLQFPISEDIDISKLVSVELHIYKIVHSMPNNLSVEIANDDAELNEFLNQPKYVEKNHENTMSGWLKSTLYMNMSYPILDDPIVFNVRTEGASVVTTGEEKPVVILRFKNQSKLSNRNRRSLNCEKHSTSCCKESLMIDFASFGWDSWILHPIKYVANYCKGTCSHDISIYRHYHSAVKHTYLKFNKTAAATLGMNTCCIPSKLSSLSMIYRDNNKTIYHKVLPNMIVESCECT